MQREQHGRPAQQHRQQRQAGNRHVHRQDVGHGLAQVVKNAPAQAHGAHDGGEVVVQQHDGCRLARHVRTAPTHGNAHMRGLERGCVVDAVAGHGDDFTVLFERLHDAQLLLWRNAGADADALHALAQCSIVELRQFVAGEQLLRRADVELCRLRNGARRGRIVARDHDDANASTAALGHRVHDLGAQRVGQAQQANEFKFKIMLNGRPRIADKARLRHAQHAQTDGRHGIDGGLDLRLCASVQMAQVDDGFGCALGRHHMTLAISLNGLPDVRHGAQLRRQTVLLAQRPVAVQVLGIGQKMLAQAVKRLLHRIKGIGHAGQDRVFHQRVKGFGQFALAGVINRQARSAVRHIELRHRHAVLGQGASLVGAQHRGCAQRLDGSNAPRQHLFFCQAPGAQRWQHGQHHGKFLRQQGHRQCNAGQQGTEPVAAQAAIGQHHEPTGAKGDQGQHTHQARRLQLQRRALVDQCLQGLTNAPDLAARTGGRDTRRAVATDQQGAREQIALRGIGRIGSGEFLHRQRLAREQRFVDLHIGAAQQNGIGRNAIAFGQQQDVATDHVGAGDALRLAIAQHARTRARHVTQSGQRVFGLALLVQRQRQHHQHQAKQDHALLQIPEHQVERAGGQQQHEHRLLQRLAHDGAQAPALLAGQHVGAIILQALRRLRCAQTFIRRR